MSKLWSAEGLKTIPQLLEEACKNWPDAIFIDFTGEKYSFSDVKRESELLAEGFRLAGVQPGDQVCSLLNNCADAVFVWFAVNRLGAVYVPINTDYKGEYLAHQVRDSGSRIIVVEAEYYERLLLIKEDVPGLERVYYRGGDVHPIGHLSTNSLDRLRGDVPNLADITVKPDDLAMLIYTSGTTGPSKGCMIPHSYACNFAYQNHWHSRTGPGDVIWSPGPLFHANTAFSVLLNALLSGATASIYRRFSVSNFWPEIERSKATHLSLLSVMLTLIPNAPPNESERRCYGQVKLVYGSPLNADLKARWRERFGVAHVAQPGYGMTEACMITLVSSYDDDVPPSASGRRTDDFDVRIIDDRGNECPPDVPGEIVVRPNRPGIMFRGYWGRPQATVDATRDLWFHTGDIGKFDENGFFYFVDRKKDYLRRGGENISSFEVEASFRMHPDIAEVAAHSVPSELSEDELKVTALLKEGSKLSEEELCRWSMTRLPHFVVPRYIEFRDRFPTTPTGKVQKHVLRSEGVTANTWDRKQAGIVISRTG